MRIGYCSPFNPMKSGISDFSEELVFGLSKYVDVVIFSPVQPANPKITDSFEVHNLSELDKPELRNSLDHIVYQVGNNSLFHGKIVDALQKYPGIVELHEIGLHNLVAAQVLEKKGRDAYLALVRRCHGERGVKIAEEYFSGTSNAPWDSHTLDLCMALPYIEKATGIIVHSEMIKQMVLGIRPDVPIVKIMHHSLEHQEAPDKMRTNCRKLLGLSEDQAVIGTFGFATPNKRILPTLDALAQVKERYPSFLYFLVGEISTEISIEQELKVRNLTDNVRVTGFVSPEEFRLYMGACDFCINLRYPTQGESSGSLHRMLGMGKPAIVTDIGTFSDYPDDVVFKVRYDRHEVEDIYHAILLLLTKRKELKRRGENALRFALEYCNLDTNAKMYTRFFSQLRDHTWTPDYEDVMISRLCDLGLVDEAYTKHFFQCLQDCLGV